MWGITQVLAKRSGPVRQVGVIQKGVGRLLRHSLSLYSQDAMPAVHWARQKRVLPRPPPPPIPHARESEGGEEDPRVLLLQPRSGKHFGVSGGYAHPPSTGGRRTFGGVEVPEMCKGEVELLFACQQRRQLGHRHLERRSNETALEDHAARREGIIKKRFARLESRINRGSGSATRDATSLVSGRAMSRSKKMAAGWRNTRRYPLTLHSLKPAAPGQVERADLSDSSEPNPTMRHRSAFPTAESTSCGDMEW
eukprot:Hpha_TRINITY_DN7210_c0_g1::TRINITY_DN7210_c0_g1_i1::g.102278::m.102278